MKKKELFVVLMILASLMLISSGVSAAEKFVFPEDMKIVETPILPPYELWGNEPQIEKCRLKDGRLFSEVSFYRIYTQEDKKFVERFHTLTLDMENFVYIHFTVLGQWQEISGVLYLKIDNQWAEYKIDSPMSFMRATEYLMPEAINNLSIDFDGCSE